MPESLAETARLMEEVCEWEKCMQALKPVKANEGSAGVDGMTVQQLPDYLKQHGLEIREQLLTGTSEPKQVEQGGNPEAGGRGVELRGVPPISTDDSFVQQAVMQVLPKRWDPTFSDHSHGFRPGRSARQAVREAQQYMAEGYRWCVDLDLEQFFDWVNADRLITAVAEAGEICTDAQVDSRIC